MKQVLLRGSATIAVVVAMFDAHATDLEVLSARQTSPGNVVVTIALPDAKVPARGELELQLDSTPLIKAGSVTSLGAPGGPAWLMLCIDRSGSITQPVLDGLKAGLNKALVEGRTGTLPFKVAMIAFATDIKHPLLDFTNEPAKVAAAIRGLTLDKTPDGRTKLHDAISSGLAALKGQAEGSKRLIVVSDGKDEGSSTTEDQLAGNVKGPPRITIDALALGALAQDNAGAISVLAGASGGRFLPNADVKDVAQPLQRLISDAVRLSRFEVEFAYTPAAADKRAAQANLLYTPAGGAQVPRLLKTTTALVAQAPPALNDPVTPATVKPDEPTPWWRQWLVKVEITINWFKNAPAALAAAAALLLALALAVWYLRVYRHRTVIVRSHEEVNVIVSPQPPPPPPPRARAPTAVGHAWQAPSPGRPVATLRGIAGNARGQLVQIDKPLFRIGCDPDNDLVLVGDDFASGAHALLRFEAGGFYVEDLGSTNGTHLNGGTFKSATRVLGPGDELRFGHTTYQVLAPSPQAVAGRSGLEPSPG